MKRNGTDSKPSPPLCPPTHPLSGPSLGPDIVGHNFLIAAVEHAADGVILTDTGGRIQYVNPSFTAMTGYSSEEVIGKNPRLLKSGRHSAEFYKEMWSTIQSGKVWRGEVANRRKDGSIYHEESRISPVQDAAGIIVGYVAIKRDTTERKRAVEALRESEERFRSMADGTPSMMWVTDAGGKIEFINRAYREFSGLTCEEARVGEWRLLLHPDDADQYISAFSIATGEHQPFSAEARVRRADGEWRLVGTRAEPRFSAQGEYLGHIGLRADITDRRQAEEERQFQHSLIRAIFEGSPDGILVVNENGEVVSHNKRFFHVWGIPDAEIVGTEQAPRKGVPPKSLMQAALPRVKRPDEFLARLQKLFADPDQNDNCEFEMADGRTLERYSTSLRNEDGRYLARVLFYRDITERKRSEEALRESRHLLQLFVDHSPAALAMFDREMRYLAVSRRWAEDHSVDALEIIGRSHYEVNPEVPERWKETHRRGMAGEMQRMEEDSYERADGTTQWIRWNIAPWRAGDDSVGGIVMFYEDISERRRSQEALKESEERFRIMADSCPIGIWATDPEGGTRFINRTYRKFCGIDADLVDPNDWLTRIHPDDLQEFRATFDLALKEHKSFAAVSRSLRIDGQWRWIESFAEPRFSASGEFLGLVGTGKDITDRKLAEQALQSSEEKFRQLAENIREVFWMMNAAGTEILYVGPAYEQIWGRTCDSLYRNPMDWLEAIHPDDRAEAHEVFIRQLQGESIDSEYRILTLDGHERWIRDRAFPVRDQAGETIRIAGIAEEITERKRHEEEVIRAYAEAEAANLSLSRQHVILDRERKLLRAFMDNVPDFMYVKDLESRFVIANHTVARWAGVEKPEDLIGKTDFDFYPREVASEFYADEQRVIRTCQPLIDHEETIPASAANQATSLLTTKVPLFDSEGRVTGIAGIGRDITMRKTIENALNESNLELREATDWATKLAFEAEAANRAKSEFLANMSHEIRTPMNGVLGMIGLLLGTGLDPDQRHYAQVVDDSAKALLTVIDDILDYSKVEAGKLEIDTVDFNLHLLMGDFSEMMAQRIGEKPLEFVCAVAPNVCPFFEGDPGRLRQVLLNLVSNAIKFTHRGEVVVRVDLISETDAEAWLRFSVRDTGIGIPLDRQPALFTSFTQVDASTTRQYGGTGLGLAISKKLVELMGGKIGLDSREGKGSEFWFTLRFGKQPEKQCVNPPQVPVKGARILVVDDNATNREVLTAQLQSWGAVVAAVESGSAALACLRYAAATGSPFQLAILDMMMPGMDGAALGRAIVADLTLNSIPLVMMTSLGQRGDAVRIKEIGFAAYLVKPVRPSDLLDCLVAVLSGNPQTQTRPLITHHSLHAARRSSARILLVEDNLTNQEVAGGLLRKLGWNADVAANGKQAIKALETEHYDLVLMDVQMPEMDGYEATRIIRDGGSSVLDHGIPIIATTAHAMTGDAEKCLAAGMSDYISKPIDAKRLAAVVEKWLTRKVHGAHEEAAAPAISVTEPEPANAPMDFNRESFLARMMGDEGFAREVAAQFLDELPTLLGKLKEGVTGKDLESVWKQAHKMKGSAANVGGEALRNVALELEQAGRSGDLSTVVNRISELEIRAARLSLALQQFTN
jgi:PAS domain S-box-containing protein